ncbi:MAG: cobyric acid synthase [Ornithinimicrobium sp.]
MVGATSSAGKSTVAAALCRSWTRAGRDVAPFKAQNMSNHSAVTVDGGEVGRSQAMQALAARVELDRRMNPILLKPSRGRSHVVVLGDEQPGGPAEPHAYGDTARSLRPVVLEALDSLRTDHAWLVAEGAGGAAEINLFDRDLVNLPLAAAAGIPAILVVDIDRGGAFAAAHGTVDLLPPHLRAPLVGIVFNQMRGDASLLDSGLAELERRTHLPVLGVLPHLGARPRLGAEDSLDVTSGPVAQSRSPRPVRVVAVRLPHLANASDLDPLLTEPDVEVRWADRPEDLDVADLIIIPGSRATVHDLAWLRETGFADRIARSTSSFVLGLCAGYQMLGTLLHDDLESGVGTVPGLGMLDIQTRFEAPKVVCRSGGSWGGHPVDGYQIRWGRPVFSSSPWLEIDGEPEGAVDPSGRVRGTSVHSILDRDAARHAFLGEVATARRRNFVGSSRSYAEAVDQHLDELADWAEAHLDTEQLAALASAASPPGHGPGWWPASTPEVEDGPAA